MRAEVLQAVGRDTAGLSPSCGQRVLWAYRPSQRSRTPLLLFSLPLTFSLPLSFAFSASLARCETYVQRLFLRLAVCKRPEEVLARLAVQRCALQHARDGGSVHHGPQLFTFGVPDQGRQPSPPWSTSDRTRTQTTLHSAPRPDAEGGQLRPARRPTMVMQRMSLSSFSSLLAQFSFVKLRVLSGGV